MDIQLIMENKNKPLVKTGDENPVNRTSTKSIYICNDCGMELIDPYCVECNSKNVEECIEVGN